LTCRSVGAVGGRGAVISEPGALAAVVQVNPCFPKSSSTDDGREGSSAVVEDDREPSWANNPELIEIRRRTLDEFDRELDQREPGAPHPSSSGFPPVESAPGRTAFRALVERAIRTTQSAVATAIAAC
jgi:hypothetical protein